MDRRALVVCCAIAFGTQTVLAAADGRGAIRSANRDSRLAKLLVHGKDRSGTLRQLVESLEASDVIVYVSFVQSQARAGHLAHQVAVAGRHRYLRVTLKAGHSDRVLIPVLAHELQHAVEVAQVPHVNDSDSIRALFERIGFKALESGLVHETQEALRVERRVRSDLRA